MEFLRPSWFSVVQQVLQPAPQHSKFPRLVLPDGLSVAPARFFCLTVAVRRQRQRRQSCYHRVQSATLRPFLRAAGKNLHRTRCRVSQRLQHGNWASQQKSWLRPVDRRAAGHHRARAGAGHRPRLSRRTHQPTAGAAVLLRDLTAGNRHRPELLSRLTRRPLFAMASNTPKFRATAAPGRLQRRRWANSPPSRTPPSSSAGSPRPPLPAQGAGPPQTHQHDRAGCRSAAEPPRCAAPMTLPQISRLTAHQRRAVSAYGRRHLRPKRHTPNHRPVSELSSRTAVRPSGCPA